MANKDKVMAALKIASGLMCDDCLTKHARLKQRQIAYSICSQLSRDGDIKREQNNCAYCRGYKLVNRLSLVVPAVAIAKEIVSVVPEDASEVSSHHDLPWHWEGNVQAALVTWLAANGYAIRAVADTAARSPGKDVIAIAADGTEWWFSVKGYPTGTERTNAATQARHWFSGAILDTVLYRDERKDVAIAAVFPDCFPTYLKLAERTAWLREATPFTLFWVAQDGAVRRQ